MRSRLGLAHAIHVCVSRATTNGRPPCPLAPSYIADGQEDFHPELLRDCERVVRFARARGKLPAICEFGVAGGMQNLPSATTAANWYMDAFLSPLRASEACSRVAFAYTWRNSAETSYWVPLPGQPGYPGFRAFFESNSTIFAGDSRLSDAAGA